MLRLYLDEDAMSAALVRALSDAGVDVSTASREGARGREDAEQLALATSLQRTLYTFNVRDFARLHAMWLRQGRHHAGIILVNDQRLPVGEQARRLLMLGTSFSPQDIADRIEFLGAWG
ncbi:MAG: DUF5615 family PIN-like protein [Dehalococcoidia bacterium]